MLYLDSLGKDHQEVFSKLKDFSGEFVLSGGTALMLQINHRRSFDFDCFSGEPIDKTLLPKVRRIFGSKINVQVDNQDMLLFTTPQKVKIDFVYYPYPPLHGLLKSGSIPLFDVRDLASNKAYTVGRRATWRDYVDIFVLLRKNLVGLDNVIAEAKKRFMGEFSEKLFLEQLVYFKDLEIFPIDFIERKFIEEEIKDFFRMEVRRYTKAKLSKK
jgi:hypothetical protein